jgi:hypothetical protein
MKQHGKQTNIRPGLYYFYAAGIATGVAGILHLRLFSMGLERGINEIGIFFLVSVRPRPKYVLEGLYYAIFIIRY